ncbi:MAG: hypothetical protein DRN99_01200 [Thermoproteota archaeon]|nr:MAG: hypothetical protein DRN99_01200 [Candidatus Korarchaeota archaeon]
MIRYPAVAGLFYPGDEKSLKQAIEQCFKGSRGPGCIPEVKESKPSTVVSLIVPHAGLQYSGEVAAHSYAALAEDGTPHTAVVIGPNHTGIGARIAVSPHTAWKTPLGEVKVDTKLAEQVVSEAAYAEFDELAHEREHSIEVQLPFLQYLFKDQLKIVAITMMDQSLTAAKDLAQALERTLTPGEHVLIATSDLTHYEPHDVAVRKDSEVIDSILRLSAGEIVDAARKRGYTVCGYGAIATAALYSLKKGVKRGELLKYSTSGDVTGDLYAVVGYAAIAYKKA